MDDNWFTIIAPKNSTFRHIYGEEKDKDRYKIELNYPNHVSNLITYTTALTEGSHSLMLIINNKSSYDVFVRLYFDGNPILDKSLS